jgi:hypothetical protein
VKTKRERFCRSRFVAAPNRQALSKAALFCNQGLVRLSESNTKYGGKSGFFGLTKAGAPTYHVGDPYLFSRKNNFGALVNFEFSRRRENLSWDHQRRGRQHGGLSNHS